MRLKTPKKSRNSYYFLSANVQCSLPVNDRHVYIKYIAVNSPTLKVFSLCRFCKTQIKMPSRRRGFLLPGTEIRCVYIVRSVEIC